MASGIRAFVARFVTDASAFRTEKIVAELQEAETAAENLNAVSTEGLEAELESLRYAADRTARDIDSSFDQAGTSITDPSGSGFRGQLKSAGGEIGSEFSENIGEAFRGGDLKDTILETFTSLGPALGIAGIAVGAGAAIVNGIISGAKERQEALKAQLDEMVVLWRDGLGRLNAEARRARIEAALDDPESELNAIRELVKGVTDIPGIKPLPDGTVEAMLFGSAEQRENAAARYEAWMKRAAAKAEKLTRDAYASGALEQGGDVGLSQLAALNRKLDEQTGLIDDAAAAARDQIDLFARLGLLTDDEVSKLERRDKLMASLSDRAQGMIERQARIADEAEREAAARERSASAAERTTAATGARRNGD